jgi:hypothetical protein
VTFSGRYSTNNALQITTNKSKNIHQQKKKKNEEMLGRNYPVTYGKL